MILVSGDGVVVCPVGCLRGKHPAGPARHQRHHPRVREPAARWSAKPRPDRIGSGQVQHRAIDRGHHQPEHHRSGGGGSRHARGGAGLEHRLQHPGRQPGPGLRQRNRGDRLGQHDHRVERGQQRPQPADHTGIPLTATQAQPEHQHRDHRTGQDPPALIGVPSSRQRRPHPDRGSHHRQRIPPTCETAISTPGPASTISRDDRDDPDVTDSTNEAPDTGVCVDTHVLPGASPSPPRHTQHPRVAHGRRRPAPVPPNTGTSRSLPSRHHASPYRPIPGRTPLIFRAVGSGESRLECS